MTSFLDSFHDFQVDEILHPENMESKSMPDIKRTANLVSEFQVNARVSSRNGQLSLTSLEVEDESIKLSKLLFLKPSIYIFSNALLRPQTQPAAKNNQGAVTVSSDGTAPSMFENEKQEGQLLHRKLTKSLQVLAKPTAVRRNLMPRHEFDPFHQPPVSTVAKPAFAGHHKPGKQN